MGTPKELIELLGEVPDCQINHRLQALPFDAGKRESSAKNGPKISPIIACCFNSRSDN
jgi:hypothetical protein